MNVLAGKLKKNLETLAFRSCFYGIFLFLLFSYSWNIRLVHKATIVLHVHRDTESVFIVLNGTLFFLDVDECKLPKSFHHCQQICVNTPGSYYCRCEKGFRLSANGKVCIGRQFHFLGFL